MFSVGANTKYRFLCLFRFKSPPPVPLTFVRRKTIMPTAVARILMTAKITRLLRVLPGRLRVDRAL